MFSTLQSSNFNCLLDIQLHNYMCMFRDSYLFSVMLQLSIHQYELIGISTIVSEINICT